MSEENYNPEIEDEHEPTSDERSVVHKNITIRGINSEIYGEFSKNIKSLEMNIGDALSKMMTDVNTDFDETFPNITSKTLKVKPRLSINHYGELSVSKADLEEAGGKVDFQHIKYLTFEADVTREMFHSHVGRVAHCKVVEIPSIFPKLLAYSKIEHCAEIKIYDVPQQE